MTFNLNTVSELKPNAIIRIKSMSSIYFCATRL